MSKFYEKYFDLFNEDNVYKIIYLNRIVTNILIKTHIRFQK